jgi:hypothetical protein
MRTIEKASSDLREGIETSRRIVRKSRVLIGLLESDRPALATGGARTASN